MLRSVAIAALAVVPGAASAPTGSSAAPAWELVYVTGYVYSEFSVQGATRIMLSTSRRAAPRELARGTRPEWSPDGTRIAFAALGGGIEIMGPDGAGRRSVAPAGTQPAWSPDGRSLAFVSGHRIAVVAAGGGTPRLLPGGDWQDSGPAWSPDGGRIAFVTREQGDADIAIVNADGTGRVVLGDPPVQQSFDRWEDERPRWSPTEAELTFTRRYAGSGHPPRFGSLWRSRADGTVAEAITGTACCGEWSSNGTRLLYVQETSAPCIRCSGDADAEPGEIAVIGRDATGSRPLTSGSLPDAEPRWASEDALVLFLSARDTRRAFDSEPHEFSSRITNAYLANDDGSCATRLTSATRARTVVHARLRPGSSTRRLHCVDLSLSIRGPSRLARATRFTTSVTVTNVGDRSAGASTVTVASQVASLRSASSRGARCRVRPKLLSCELPPIPAGGRRTISVKWRSTRGPTYQYAEVKVVGVAPEGDIANNVEFLEYEVTSCTHLGTESSDDLRGTAGVDRICAGGGGDKITALAGDDVVDGGTGADLIDPGAGRDSVRGNWGNDTILARDGTRDVISCGLDTDRVVADAVDTIREDCERVELP